jgi:hypothetical protein
MKGISEGACGSVSQEMVGIYPGAIFAVVLYAHKMSGFVY